MALTCIVCEIYRLIGGKSRKFYTPLVFSAPAAGDPVGLPRKRMIFIKLSHGEKNCDDMLSSFNTIPEPGEQMDIYNSDINIAHQYCCADARVHEAQLLLGKLTVRYYF